MSERKIIAVRDNKKIYRQDDQLVKVFDHNLISKTEVLREALNQSIVEETGLSIPAILSVHKEDQDWCISSRFIEGKTLEELMNEDPDNKNKYIEKLVDIQIDFQKLSCPQLIKLRDKMNNRISHSGLDASTRYELHMKLDSLPRHIKLCHGDFNPSNVIVDASGKYFILDWAHATNGNASADVANTYIDFLLKGDKRDAEYYLKYFCKKTDTAIQYVQKWMPIVAAAISVRRKPEEREELLKMVNVVEYE